MPRKLREVAGEEFGDFFKFEKLGQFIEGTFEKQRASKAPDGKPQQVFDIRLESGTLVSVNGKDIEAKMAKVPPGTFVRIEYVNNKELPRMRDGTARNPMRMFKVEVPEDVQLVAARAPAQSEDDIPF